MTDGSLRRVRIVELGGGIAAAFATRILADLGADVVKVEPPGGDPLRRAEPLVHDASGRETSALFEYLNWSKRSVELPLASTEATELATTADIAVLEPGGYEPESLRAANPSLVVVSVSAFGADGPYAEWKDGELVIQAMGGLMQITGSRDREPLKGGLRQPFYYAGLNAAWASLAAYIGRLETGVGAFLDLSLRDCVASQLIYNQPFYAFAGLVQSRRPARREPFSGDPFPAGDTFMSIQTSAFLQMKEYAELFDGDSRLESPEFATQELRTRNAERLGEIIGEHIAASSPREFFVRASERGFLAAFSQDAASLLSCPQMAARGVWHEFEDLPGIRFPAALAALSRTPARAPRRAPALGRHTREVLAEPRRVAPSALPAARRRPLAGVRVLDLSTVLAVPYLGALLADLGAEVIKVEAPHRLDQMRVGLALSFDNEPAGDPWDRSAIFQVLNRGKRAMSLDLGKEDGRDVLRALVKDSDVLLENFTPRVMRKWGLTYDDLATINPRLVMLSNTGYGSTGPWSAFKAQGTSLETTMGLPEVSGYADGFPMRVGNSYPDFLACWMGLAALLAALVERRSSGRGQWIDIGMYQLGAAVIPESLLHCQVHGAELGRRGNHDADALFSAVVPAAGEDRWLAVAASDGRELAALERLVGGRDRLEAWARLRDPVAAATELQAAGVAAGPVLNARDLLDDPQLRARGFYEWVDYGEELGLRPLIGRPFTWSSEVTEVGIDRPAPRFGQDNDWVLREVMGLDQSAIERLYALAVVTAAPVNARPAVPLNLELQLESGQLTAVDRDYRDVLGAAASATAAVRS
jgi:crotonobetainyl-CoA:carnitine CoA-transferase CaiB-like acyl-CoA transferase